MGSLGTLAIELAANTAQLTSDMGKAVGIVERSSANMGRALKGIATGALIGTLANVARSSIEFGDNLSKAAVKAGVGGKAISELAYAARMSDVDLSSLSTALRKMQVALSQAGSGAKQPIEALKALGLSVRDLAGMSADRQFELIGDRISKLKDPADRARAATELFGKAGADLLPMFEQGADGIRKAREEADKLGLSFTDKQLKTFADADDALKRLKASGEGLAAALTAKLAPSLSYVALELQSLVSGQKIDRLATLREEIRVLEQSLTPARIKDPFISLGKYDPLGGAPDVAPGFYNVEERVKKLAELRRKLNILAGEGRGAGRYKMPFDTSGLESPGFAAAADVDLDELNNVVVKAKKVHLQTIGEMLDSTRTYAEREVAEYREKLAQLDQLREERFIDETEYQKRLAEIQEEYDERQLSAVQVTAQRSAETWKDATDAMSVYADEAARNMQDAFADFLFDPFDDGLKGMLRGFVDILRRMAAEAAAAQIFESKDKGGFGVGDLLRIGLGAAVNGGGSSSIPTGPSTAELMAAGPSYSMESILPSSSAGASKITVAPVYNIDARGATQDLAKALPAILEANNKQVIEAARIAVRDDQSRRGRA